ncbi:MAG: hypothetical protein Q4B22_09850 [Eubacteriales bacterium]|nr:hypothetical protein [Eubacteriales bacterium]
MFGLDSLFDFNGDGKLDVFERAVEFQFLDEMTKSENSGSYGNEDESDVFADAGLDYDELEFMGRDERREALEDAGLDPDEFDF